MPSRLKFPFLADSYDKWNYCPASRNVYFSGLHNSSIGAAFRLRYLACAKLNEELNEVNASAHGASVWRAGSPTVSRTDTTCNCPIRANMFTKLRVFTRA